MPKYPCCKEKDNQIAIYKHRIAELKEDINKEVNPNRTKIWTGYKVVWRREAYMSAIIYVPPQIDPQIYIESHARSGELVMEARCGVKVHSPEVDIISIEKIEE